MDYIRQELRRQQAALGRLLLGRAEKKGEADRQTAASPAGQLPTETEKTGLWRGGNESGDKLSADAELAWELLTAHRLARDRSLSLPGGQDAAAEMFWEPGSSQSAASGDEQGGEIVSPPESGDERERTRAQDRSADGASMDKRKGRTQAEEAVLRRIVTEVTVASARDGIGPEALSRSFQRDARRYDGGFTLY